jgi:hypothetical protein
VVNINSFPKEKKNPRNEILDMPGYSHMQPRRFSFLQSQARNHYYQAPSQSLLYYWTVKTGKDLLLLPGTSTVRLYIGTVAVVTVI